MGTHLLLGLRNSQFCNLVTQTLYYELPTIVSKTYTSHFTAATLDYFNFFLVPSTFYWLMLPITFYGIAATSSLATMFFGLTLSKLPFIGSLKLFTGIIIQLSHQLFNYWLNAIFSTFSPWRIFVVEKMTIDERFYTHFASNRLMTALFSYFQYGTGTFIELVLDYNSKNLDL